MPFKFSPGHCGEGDCGCGGEPCIPCDYGGPVCCIPKVDMVLVLTRSGPFGGTATYNLIYSETPYQISTGPFGVPGGTTTASHWRSEPVSTPWLSTTPTSVAYFDCDMLWAGFLDKIAFFLYASKPGYPYGWVGDPDIGYGWTYGAAFDEGCVCDPFHLESDDGSYTSTIDPA